MNLKVKANQTPQKREPWVFWYYVDHSAQTKEKYCGDKLVNIKPTNLDIVLVESVEQKIEKKQGFLSTQKKKRIYFTLKG